MPASPHQFVNNVRVHSASLKVVSEPGGSDATCCGEDVLKREISGRGANLPPRPAHMRRKK